MAAIVRDLTVYLPRAGLTGTTGRPGASRPGMRPPRSSARCRWIPPRGGRNANPSGESGSRSLGAQVACGAMLLAVVGWYTALAFGVVHSFYVFAP